MAQSVNADQGPQPENTPEQTHTQPFSLLDNAFDHFPAAAFLIDEGGGFRNVSDKTCRLLGYNRTELLQLTVADIDIGWSVALWQDQWHALKSSGAITFDAFYKKHDGQVFPVEKPVQKIQ
ncbi:MAG TPA: PAS domain S-box protein [Methylophilaceae bacterium]|nr:PAS domain S-box protein [Methylophilaceae bacterium]